MTSPGDRREAIFEDDVDRQALLEMVAQGAGRFEGQVLACCLMGNHHHFVLHTRAANLSRLMQRVNVCSCPAKFNDVVIPALA